MEQLWVLKSKGDEASFGGNTGYADSPDAYYLYDTTVKNHNRIKVGDFVVIVNKHNIIGYAQITSIDIKKQQPKLRFSCPHCKTHELSTRKTKTPKYRCREKHEFDIAVEEKIIVDEYTASYSSTFQRAKSGTSVKELDGFYLKRNLYYSIQPASMNFVDKKFPKQMTWVESITSEPDMSYLPLYVKPYLPISTDEREKKYKQTAERKNQDKFRRELVRVYGSYCMITGLNILAAIEASHICPYRGEKDNHIHNGLLLRSDLHKLFDCNLLGIDPLNLTIDLHPVIKSSAYSKYQGAKIKYSRTDCQPSKEALEVRWKIYQESITN